MSTLSQDELAAAIRPGEAGRHRLGDDRLQRDLGGAIVQSIFGALLTAGYAATAGATIASAPNEKQITDSVENQLTKSFAGTEDSAQEYPQYASQITSAARRRSCRGDPWAYTAGVVAVLLGAALVFFFFFFFPKKTRSSGCSPPTPPRTRPGDRGAGCARRRLWRPKGRSRALAVKSS